MLKMEATPAVMPRFDGNYRRRPEVFRAHRVTTHNAAKIAAWCGGSTLSNGVRVPTTMAGLAFDLYAAPDMWVTQDMIGNFEVFTDTEFRERFDQVIPK